MASPTSHTRDHWRVPDGDPEGAADLAKSLHISPLLAAILLNRDIRTPGEARQFLKPDLNALLDPLQMKDMDLAIARIRTALLKGERIMIFGDYDVDGVTATTLLKRLFSVMGHPVASFIPNRLIDGYGLTRNAAKQIAQDQKTDLVVTVDCGISDHAGVTILKEHGIDVIVTDHHVAPPALPPAAALINPMRPDCPYPFKRLAGVGVAFKLAWALATEFSPRRRMSEEFRDFLFEATGLVALGTVCDVVPLQEENRVLVSYGLRSLVDSPNPGLRALLEVAGLANRTLEPLHLGFKIGPRINAAGRMGFPGDALSLLTSSSYQEAIDFATRLDTLNTRRQNQERSILTQVLQTLEEKSHPVGGSVVIAQRGWSPGIMGIVAARLVDIHRAPAVLISMTETNARGSGRSIPGFNLLDVLKECQSYLTDFGGHASAVGFTLELDQVEAFVHDFHKLLREKLAGFFPESGYAIDHQVDLQDLSQDLIRELDQLKPYGECNPPPLFLTRNVKIAGHPRPVGKKKKFLKFLVNQSGNTSPVSAIGPMGTMTPENLKALSPCDILHIPHRVFRGGQEVLELRVKAIVKSGSRD